MRSILKNVSPTHRMMTHHLKTTFREKKLRSRAFFKIMNFRESTDAAIL
jgi:sulfur relay (sulfurtransferase) DsrC/TusE family protein